MEKQPEKVNPFAEAAAVGAMAEELKRIEWRIELNRREAHLKACEMIMKVGVLPRLQLAADAVRNWGKKAEVIGVTRSETYAGTVHFRAKLIVDEGTNEMRYLEFIASPKSMVIAAEGAKAYENRRWQKISLTADAISNHSDKIISGFLTWGWVKRE